MLHFCLGAPAVQSWFAEGQVWGRENEGGVWQEGHGGHLFEKISPEPRSWTEVWDWQVEGSVTEGQGGLC